MIGITRGPAENRVERRYPCRRRCEHVGITHKRAGEIFHVEIRSLGVGHHVEIQHDLDIDPVVIHPVSDHLGPHQTDLFGREGDKDNGFPGVDILENPGQFKDDRGSAGIVVGARRKYQRV